ncbi:MAG: cytochrome ubiquinol oxidase subunit I [Thermodesulfovibrionales bacterium]
MKEFPKEERPPVLLTLLSFRAMSSLGMLFMLLALIAFVLSRQNRLESVPLFLWVMLYAIPFPYLATQLGWIVAEVGKQPWIVYGVLRTTDAVSRNITTGQVVALLFVPVVIAYQLWIFRIFRHAVTEEEVLKDKEAY